jgi:hypothetical protein
MCETNQKLSGCGYGEVGACTSCGAPPTGIDFLSRVVTINAVRECAPSCNAGYQVTEDPTSPIKISCKPIPPVDDNYDDNG